MTKSRNRAPTEGGSSNGFRDSGFSNRERWQLRADLAAQIHRLIKGRDLTQAQAGEILGIRQPHVSVLMRGHSGTFSMERLMEFLTALGQDVQITVRPTRKDHGGLSVSVPLRRPLPDR